MRKTLGALLCALSTVVVLLALNAPATSVGTWWDPPNRPAVDSEINATGAPFTGSVNGEVRGFADLHNHVMSNEGFGGALICGKPFDPHGIEVALKDCDEHYPDGRNALFENVTGGADGTHDPVGWPTFGHWPAYDSLSHQQNYYAWIERAWRGGQRIMVNDLVSNGLLCSINPGTDRSCDEMDAIRLEAQKTYEMQDYIDDIYGGPGKGFFRIVKTPEQARSVIESGRLAVVLGVETSEPFGCKMILDVAQCDKADIDAGIQELYDLGVRSMFLCHKYDNALCGVRFDEHTNGVAVNVGQFLSTGTWWETEQCRGPEEDNPFSTPTQALIDAMMGATLPAGTPLPTYQDGKKCNRRGLTGLGEYAVQKMIDKRMMLEIDHMSVKAADRALDILEANRYPGVLSTHSWMSPRWTERLYRLGGVIAQYGHGSEEFVDTWQRDRAVREQYGKGYAYGMDMNGVGGTPPPRNGATKVQYPFRSFDGGTLLDRQTTGQRTWDVNVDGVAHYGQVPDWVEDIRLVGGKAVVDDLARGAESYLDTWADTAAWTKPTNLALNRPVWASSQEWVPFKYLVPNFGRDGNYGTRWASKWSDAQWYKIDLGSVQQVGRVTLAWENAHAKGHRIETSLDGTNWTTAWSTTNGQPGLETAFFAPRQARWVRWVGTQRATSYGYSFWEIEVYGR